MINPEELIEEKRMRLNGSMVRVRVPKKLSPKMRETVKKDLERTLRRMVSRKFGS